MTLKQIKAMFAVGQKWHAINTWTHADAPRELIEKRTTQLVWKSSKAPRFSMDFPQASQIIAAHVGHLSFRIFKESQLLRNDYTADRIETMRAATLTLTLEEEPHATN